MFTLNFSTLTLSIRHTGGKAYVFDPIRKKWLVLTPEEQVRQYVLQYMLQTMNYPRTLIAVEKAIKFGTLTKRFDIVIYNQQHQPWMLVECKAPDVAIDEKALYQLLNYNQSMQCSYWLLTNGHTCYCADARDVTNIKWMGAMPVF